MKSISVVTTEDYEHQHNDKYIHNKYATTIWMTV